MPLEVIGMAFLVLIFCVFLGISIAIIMNKFLGNNKHNEAACNEINKLLEMHLEINKRIKEKFKHLSKTDKNLTAEKWGNDVMGKIS